MKDYEYIKDRFDRDGISAPDSLSKEAMMARLDEANPAKKPEDPREKITAGKSPKKTWRRPLIAVAACACLALGLIPVVKAVLPANGGNSQLTADANGLYQFQSYRELDRHLKSMGKQAETEGFGKTDGMTLDGENETDYADSAEAPNMVTGNGYQAKSEEASDGAGSSDHSNTYTQVDGVDEADVVKTDGKNIYFVSRMENQVIIAEAANGKAHRIASVSGGETCSDIQDIYVHDGKLILVGTKDQSVGNETYAPISLVQACAVVYDITDPTKPEEVSSFAQTGYLISSRMVGNYVYLVSNEGVYDYTLENHAPALTYGGETSRLPIEDISCIPDSTSPDFTVIGSLNTATGKSDEKSVKAKAILGGSSEIYCSKDTLYVTTPVYEESRPGIFNSGYGDLRTRVLRVSLSKGKIRSTATQTVKGRINNQFSMDESGDYFRIATTAWNGETDANNLFILDKKLKLVGSLENFAKDEHIEAVRFIGDKAYVITYEQIDPLFIIDLAKPTDPVIKGHVEISGFSTLLVPSGKDHLLGLGFSTEDTATGESAEGVKLALFDVSHPMSPKVSDSLEFPGMSSAVQYDHKALLVGPGSSFYAIPFTRYPDNWVEIIEDAEMSLDAETGDTDSADGTDGSGDTIVEPPAPSQPTYGILAFTTDKDKLNVLKEIPTKEALTRCIYIGQYLYGITEKDTIEGFPLPVGQEDETQAAEEEE